MAESGGNWLATSDLSGRYEQHDPEGCQHMSVEVSNLCRSDHCIVRASCLPVCSRVVAFALKLTR